MRGKLLRRLIFGILLILQFSVCLATETPNADEDSKYLDAVRKFADNVLKYGRDTYGPKHTPLFVDGLNIHTHETVKWRCQGQVWILSDLACQQNLFRTLDGLSKITGDPKYRQAAVEAIEYAFANLRRPNGLLHWGGHAAYDAQADKMCMRRGKRYVHELKYHFPYYELMWAVEQGATKQFIESFWSAHILDWSNLDMNRHGPMGEPLPAAWKHEYKGGAVFFRSRGLSFINTGSDLIYAGAILSKLSGEKQPLIWSKRLAHRYVETRNPKTGLSGSQYTRLPRDRAQFQFGEDFKGHLVLEGTLIMGGEQSTPRAQICQLLLAEMLGEHGKEFIQWPLDRLTALGKVAYRKKDNSWIPMLADGTSMEGYKYTKGGYFGPKGTICKAVPAGLLDFWMYTLAYRVTGEEFMWEMAGSIARGNGFGDIGTLANDEPKFNTKMDCSDPYALLGFLELYSKTQNDAFLEMASKVGDNILAERFYRGFFVPSKKVVYTKFDYVEPLVLLQLYETLRKKPPLVPQVWPSKSFFACDYDGHERGVDTIIIYSQTKGTDLMRLLHEAAWDGNTDEVKSLISKGADVNAGSRVDPLTFQRIWGMSRVLVPALKDRLTWDITALHYAVRKGNREVAELLMAKGANVNAMTKSGDTPLHYAAEEGRKEIAELLIAKGADVNAKNNDGQTPIDIALNQNHKDIVELLLAKGADVNARNGKDETPLHYAAEKGHKEIAELLIAKGADVNAKNKHGRTPIDVAFQRKREDIVELLLQKGATIYTMHMAAYIGDLARVKAFIQEGIDVNMKVRGRTPLHYAARQGHKEIVEMLLANGADVNAGTNTYNKTPAEFAMANRHNEVVELLISKGAVVYPLHLAVSMRELDKVRSLIRDGADVNKSTQYGTTAIYIAALAGFKDIAELLIDKGADVNARDNWDWTPLHSAAENGQKDVVELLIAKGANVNARDGASRTPLWYAQDEGHTEIVELLRKHGAKE